MLGILITQILKPELIVPVTKIGLMIIGPAGPASDFRGMFTVGTKSLIAVHTDNMAQSARMIKR
jgi:ketol-acid reductoisomerase